MPTHLVLLPGMDGTGQLFAGLRAALPQTTDTISISYPANEFLAYSELLRFVGDVIPTGGPCALVAESFSTPVALEYAASNPPNLLAVVICSGFVFKPIAGWSQIANAVARPWFFKLRLPRWVIEHFLVGPDAPPALIRGVRQALQSVSPTVLCRRLHEALNCDAREALARTSVPILYIQAAQDKLLASTCPKEFRRIKPDIFFELVDGPHLLAQREPQKVANFVMKFLESLGS